MTENAMRETTPDEDYFGCCPVCGYAGTLHDIHPRGDVYLVCDEHRIAWGIGNVIGSLKDAARSGMIAWDGVERMAAENREKLRNYRFIEPLEATGFAQSPDCGSRPWADDFPF